MTDTLILFDVDGTLIDSQAHIIAAMHMAFEQEHIPPPKRASIKAIIGLSLPQAFARLCPALPQKQREKLAQNYQNAFATLRATYSTQPLAPLYPNALTCLALLHAQNGYRLGVATGKSKRGMDHVMAMHQLEGYFSTVQVADFHPSKPNPSMAFAAMEQTQATRGVMIGDTVFDMEMGRAAGLKTIGVTWGYHSAKDLCANADVIAEHFMDIPALILQLWE